MRIGLIDVDGHNFPNLCLMKLSAYHKRNGDNVEWWNNESHYDVTYMSKVFSNEYSPSPPPPENSDRIICGGTGYAISLNDNGIEEYDCSKDHLLPDEIEHIYPDYSIYPQHTGYGRQIRAQTAYGFLTRGCPRHCNFCHVASKEGTVCRKVADVNEFWNGQGHICLSDPNILAYKNCEELLLQLVNTRARIDFNQGLDARLVTQDKAELLASMKLKKPQHFAMDSMQSMSSVVKGLDLFRNAYIKVHNSWDWRNVNVYCLVNFDTTYEQDMERIKAIQDCGYRPYVMVYNKPNAPKICKRLQRWTNNVFCYARSKTFEEYLNHEYKHKVIL